MDLKRGAGVREVVGVRVLKQAGDDHRVWGAGVNDLFMDPSGPWWPLGIHQTDATREGGVGGWGGGAGGAQMEGWRPAGLKLFSKHQRWNSSRYKMARVCACVSLEASRTQIVRQQ